MPRHHQLQTLGLHGTRRAVSMSRSQERPDPESLQFERIEYAPVPDSEFGRRCGAPQQVGEGNIHAG